MAFNSKTNWDLRFLNLAKEVAGWSKDRSTKVGCVIVDDNYRVLSLGYNGFPSRARDDVEIRHQRPLKYKWSEHAERNAIYNACRNGLSLKGTTICVTYFPCTDCARGIIQSGIKAVVCESLPDFKEERWGADQKIALEMLEECGVEVRFLDKEASRREIEGYDPNN